MTLLILKSIFIILGGLTNRWRGAAFAPEGLDILHVGSTIKRVVLSILTGLYAWFCLGFPLTFMSLLILPVVLTTFLGLIMAWGDHMAVGRIPPTYEKINFFKWLLDTFIMSDIGLLFTIGWVPMAIFVNPIFWYLVVSGFGMGLMYNIGWLIPSTLKDWERGPPLAEFLFGSWLWTSIFLIISLI